MKKYILTLIIFTNVAFADLVQVPLVPISDNDALNYFFSMVLYVFLLAVPSKIALQVLWDYARSIK